MGAGLRLTRGVSPAAHAMSLMAFSGNLQDMQAHPPAPALPGVHCVV